MQKLSTDVLQFVENHVFNVTELVHSGKLGQILDTFAETKSEAIYIVQSDGEKSAKAVIVDLEFFKELFEYREAVESAMDEGGAFLEAWNSDQLERYETIDGVIFDMTPSPSEAHQRVTTAIGSLLFSALNGQCRTYVAPFDVWPTGDIHDAYVQPDVTVVCDLAKLTAVGCVGAPDLVVEVLSSTTAGKDRKAKRR